MDLTVASRESISELVADDGGHRLNVTGHNEELLEVDEVDREHVSDNSEQRSDGSSQESSDTEGSVVEVTGGDVDVAAQEMAGHDSVGERSLSNGEERQSSRDSISESSKGNY